jgi:hypothetical protein
LVKEINYLAEDGTTFIDDMQEDFLTKTNLSHTLHPLENDIITV